jgi:hypothetical protein
MNSGARRATEKSPQPFQECESKRTLVVDLPVERHQCLDGLDVRIVRVKMHCIVLPFIVHQLIGQVFNRVAKLLQSTSRLRRNIAAPFLSCQGSFRPGKFSKMKPTRTDRCHILVSFPASPLSLMLYIGGCQVDL